MEQHLRKLTSHAIKRTFYAGSMIMYQGEAPRSALVLLKGVVRVHSISAQGDEQIVTFHIAGEFFPSSWIFGKAPVALFFYEALTDCEVAFVPREQLLEFMMSNPERVAAMMDYFTTNYSAWMIRVNALEQPRAREKLIYTLYYLCERYGIKKANGVHIPIGLTHQHLASLVGLTRETTATELAKLKKQKIIDYKQQKYNVHLPELLELIGEDSFLDVSIKDD